MNDMIADVPISDWLEECRQSNSNGICLNSEILFFAKKIGFKLRKEEERMLARMLRDGMEERIVREFRQEGGSFEEEIRQRRLQEIKLGRLPR